MSESDDFVDAVEDLVDSPNYKGKCRRERPQPYDGNDRRGERGDGSFKLARLALTAIIVAGTVTTALATLGPYFPETRAAAQDAHAAINARVDKLEEATQNNSESIAVLKNDISGILTTGKKTQVLTIRSRLLEIQDRMATVGRGSPIWNDYRREQNELEEELEALRKELGK